MFAQKTFFVGISCSLVSKMRQRKERVKLVKLPQTKTSVAAHIVPALGSVRLDRLTRQRITVWLNALADEAPRLTEEPRAPRASRRAADRTD